VRRRLDKQSDKAGGEAPIGRLGDVTSVKLTPDGKTVLIGTRVKVHRYDVASGRELPSMAEDESGELQLAVSPDGQRLVGGGSRCRLALWDLATGRHLNPVGRGHVGRVFELAYSADGTRLTTVDV
jgi:WD40 repeat protein